MLWAVLMMALPALAQQNVKTFTVKGVNFKMVQVEGGTFTMGATPEQSKLADSEEKPAHKVTLSTYYIGETEVTQALWTAVMGSNPSRKKGDNLPVGCVSWNDCQDFIRKLNSLTGQRFRLPTEAEWEFAARGGKKSRGYMFSGGNTLDAVGWYNDNCQYKIHEVKSKAPNELGLYDMSGNVSEWCQDWFDSYQSSPQTNPVNTKQAEYVDGRISRGGDFNTYARFCRVSSRTYFQQDMSADNNGLRLVM